MVNRPPVWVGAGTLAPGCEDAEPRNTRLLTKSTTPTTTTPRPRALHTGALTADSLSGFTSGRNCAGEVTVGGRPPRQPLPTDGDHTTHHPRSPRDLQCCPKVRPVGSACARHRAPPRYTKCACGRPLTDHRSEKRFQQLWDSRGRTLKSRTREKPPINKWLASPTARVADAGRLF